MAQKKKGPGRPAGSKNKNKTAASSKSKSAPKAKPVKERSRLGDEIAAIVLIALGAFLIVAIQTHIAGAVGDFIGGFLKGLFGFGAYVLPYFFIIYAILMFANVAIPFDRRSIIWMAVLFLSIDLINSGRFLGDFVFADNSIGDVFAAGKELTGGGLFGMYLGGGIVKLVGRVGLYIISAVLVVISIMLLINTPLSQLVMNARERRAQRQERKAELLEKEWADRIAKEEREKEFAQKRETVDKAGRQMVMNYRTPSDRAEDMHKGPRIRKNLVDYDDPVEKEPVVRTPMKARKTEKLPKSVVKEWKKLPKNQRKILEMVNAGEEFGPTENTPGYGLDGSQPDRIEGSRVKPEDTFEGFTGEAIPDTPEVEREKQLIPNIEIPGLDEEPEDIIDIVDDEPKVYVDPFAGENADNDNVINIGHAGKPVEHMVKGEDAVKMTGSVVIGGESVATKASETEKSDSEVKVTPKRISRYSLPPVRLLDQGKGKSNKKVDKAALQEKAMLLEETLQSFKVDAKVVNVISGPSVTRYEIEPARGVKVSSITNLTDDLALNMRAKSIRIEAPIPGKAAVGIEIENEDREMICMKDIVDSPEFRNHKSKLAFTVGRDIGGKNIVADISKMPHMLIAGATGSGKSVCINSIIISLLYKARPEEVKLVLVDPKMVELGNYNGIPHLLIPVVTDANKAAGALSWAVAEMTDRYKLFAKNNVKNLGDYNAKMEAEGQKDEILPQIVIIIDELADLMMVASTQVEAAICRLAQLARAAGMHLILATQRPSVDVITGLIKANVPSRIAFMVSSQIDSRTIIDGAGAEKLVGNGDMLFKPQDLNDPKRIQGPFVSPDEIERVIEYVKSHADEPEYNQSVIDHIEKGNATVEGGSGDDELLMDAIETVLSSGQASVSMLQRRFRIGYNRAANIVDTMEAMGVIGPSNGSKARQVLITEEEFQEMKNRDN